MSEIPAPLTAEHILRPGLALILEEYPCYSHMDWIEVRREGRLRERRHKVELRNIWRRRRELEAAYNNTEWDEAIFDSNRFFATNYKVVHVNAPWVLPREILERELNKHKDIINERAND